MIHYFISRLRWGIKSFKIIFVEYAFKNIKWKTWQLVRFWCSTCVKFIPLLNHNIEPSWPSCFLKRSCKFSNDTILWAWACEQDGIFLNIFWWRERNMVTLYFVTSDKIFDDVVKYFTMYKWINFLDENIMKDVICWTSLNRWTNFLLQFGIEVPHWNN
jgi:hypothetical protein